MQHFKAYLTIIKGSVKEKEIRKFTIDSDVATSFLYLREKLQIIFPILSGKQFTITWKDIEDDSIVISTDDELRIAIQESVEIKKQKLFIKLQLDEETNVDSQPDAGVRHYHIICDGCNKDVVGFRYKCIECPDYDLCSVCEGKGLHPEHCMLRITEAIHMLPHYNKRLAHHMKKFVRNIGSCNGREENVRKCPIMKKRHHRHHGPICDSPTMMETMIDLLNSSDPPEAATEAIASCNKPQSQEAKTEENRPIDIFKVMEDTIAPVLNQFGINISMKMTDDQKSNPKPNDDPTNRTDSKGAPIINEKSNPKPDNYPTNQTESKEAPIINEKSCPKPDNVSTNQADFKEAPIINDKSGKSSDDDEWTIVNKEEKSSNVNASDITKTSSTSSNSQDTLSNGENYKHENVTPSAPVSEPSKESLYPSLPQPTVTQPILYHPNPNIQSAILSMMDMGFSNEGGWLTQLLIAENGNIDKVLDKLSPV